MISLRSCVAFSRFVHRTSVIINKSLFVRPDYTKVIKSPTADARRLHGKRTIYGSGNKAAYSRFVVKQTNGDGTRASGKHMERGSGRATCPDFQDVTVAYKAKSNRELLRAYFVFSLCSYDFLLNNQLKVNRKNYNIQGIHLSSYVSLNYLQMCLHSRHIQRKDTVKHCAISVCN